MRSKAGMANRQGGGDLCEVNTLAWHGLAWLGLDWLGLAWLGLAWLGLAWLGLAWLGLAWLGLGLNTDIGRKNYFSPRSTRFTMRSLRYRPTVQFRSYLLKFECNFTDKQY
jgi:hypothetical protein